MWCVFTMHFMDGEVRGQLLGVGAFRRGFEIELGWLGLVAWRAPLPGKPSH